jgi:hypothetical protein
LDLAALENGKPGQVVDGSEIRGPQAEAVEGFTVVRNKAVGVGRHPPNPSGLVVPDGIPRTERIAVLFQVVPTQIPRPIEAPQHVLYFSLKKMNPAIEPDNPISGHDRRNIPSDVAGIIPYAD